MVVWQNSSSDCIQGVWKKCPHDNISIVFVDDIFNPSLLNSDMNLMCWQQRVPIEDLSGIKQIEQSEGFL